MFDDIDNATLIDAFGQTVTIHDGSLAGVQLSGIFDNEDVVFDAQSGQYIDREPQLTVLWSAVKEIIESGEDGTRVGIDGVMYRVMDVITEAKNTGIARLVLGECEDL